jgi:hypothetical protein
MDHPFQDRLSEYLDGTLDPAERSAVAVHLEACRACAETLDALSAVAARARGLGPIEPETDLWAGIAARIGGEAAPAKAEGGARAGEPAPSTHASPVAAPAPARIDAHPAWWSVAFRLTLPQVAAAGVLIAALSGSAAWMLSRGVLERPVAVAPGEGTNAATVGTDLAGIDPGYEATIADLEQTLDRGRDRLDPTTVRVLTENLAIIDAAIADSRRALGADPESPFLYRHLNQQMQRKVDLLQQATVYAFAGH